MSFGMVQDFPIIFLYCNAFFWTPLGRAFVLFEFDCEYAGKTDFVKGCRAPLPGVRYVIFEHSVGCVRGASV